MLVILSPAKNMHRVPTPPHATRPMFLQQTETLAASMKRYAPFQLESVLKVNPQLALRALRISKTGMRLSPALPRSSAITDLLTALLMPQRSPGRISPSLRILFAS